MYYSQGKNKFLKFDLLQKVVMKYLLSSRHEKYEKKFPTDKMSAAVHYKIFILCKGDRMAHEQTRRQLEHISAVTG